MIPSALPVLLSPSADAAEAPPGPVFDLGHLAARAAGLAEGARAANTRRAYASDWRHFTAWCAGHGLDPLPAEPSSVGFYLTAHETTLSVATLTRRLSAIAVAHRMAGHAMDTRHPAIRDVMGGLRRARGVAQDHAEALTVPLLRRILAGCGERLIDRRDRALLLIGFMAALRRSELIALDHADLATVPDGLRVTIRRSKGDQEAEGAAVAVGRTENDTCPVAAYAAWIKAAGIGEGAVFRAIDRHGRLGQRLSANAVAEIVKRRAVTAGLEASAFSGHSMRAGFATSAASEGIEERIIMRQTRHRSITSVRRYIQDGQFFTRNLSKEIGL